MVADKFNDISRSIAASTDEDALKIIANLDKITDEVQRSVVCAALYQRPEGFGSGGGDKNPVKMALASSPYVTENVQMEIARFEPFYSNTQPKWMLEMAKNPALTAQAQQAFFDHSHDDVKRALAVNPSLTKELQEKFLRGSYTGMDIAKNRNLDPELAAEIADPDNEGWGGQTVASHYPLPEDLQRRIVDKFWDKDRGYELTHGLANNPHLAEDLQIRLAGHPEDSVRWSLARNAGVTDATASILARDSDPGIRNQIKENPAVDVNDIEIQAHQARDDLFSQLNIH